jgi:hypothetical protein
MKIKLTTLMCAKVALGAVLLLQPFMSNAQIIDTSMGIITYDSSDYDVPYLMEKAFSVLDLSQTQTGVL